MNGLVVLLPVSRDLLHARPVVQHPQAHRAVVACRGQRVGASKGNKVMRDNVEYNAKKSNSPLDFQLHHDAVQPSGTHCQR